MNKSQRVLHVYEKEYGVVLPQEYKEFIVNPDVFNYDDGFYSNDLEYVPIERPSVMCDSDAMPMDLFTKPEGLTDLLATYQGRLHTSLVPIVYSAGGDLICLGVSGALTGKVYYWEHDNEWEAKLMLDMETATDDINEYWENLYLISNSFGEFINSLTVAPEEPPNDTCVLSVWISPEFKERIAKMNEKSSGKKGRDSQ